MPNYSDAEIAAIVFNETRSLSGASIQDARIAIAHTIINASVSKHKFPKMSPAKASPGPGEQSIYADCLTAATAARGNVMSNKDPTDGAEHFNFRKTSSKADFQGHALKTSYGPFNNSYPTPDLPANGIYANTYE